MRRAEWVGQLNSYISLIVVCCGCLGHMEHTMLKLRRIVINTERNESFSWFPFVFSYRKDPYPQLLRRLSL